MVYKALDFLYCHAEVPIYEPIDVDNPMRGVREINMICICKIGDFVCAKRDPDRDFRMLVFGKYPVYSFLLVAVGKLIVKNDKNVILNPYYRYNPDGDL